MTPKEFIKSWFAYIDANNYDALTRMIDDRHQFNNPLTAGVANKQTHLGMIKQMSKALEGRHVIDLIVSEGEWVVARGHWIGRHSGEFNGIPATDRTVNFSWIDMMQIVNGKLSEEYFEMNPMTILHQINAVPAD